MIRYEFLIKTPNATYRSLCTDWSAIMSMIADCKAQHHRYGIRAL